MQFSVLALISLVALVAAGPTERNQNIKRQNAITGGIPVNQPAMTDANGNVIAFDADNVYQDAKARGQ